MPKKALSEHPEKVKEIINRQVTYFLYLKKHPGAAIPTLLRFETVVRLLRNADNDHLGKGQFDAQFAECLAICEARKDRFLFQKLAYVLFSGERQSRLEYAVNRDLIDTLANPQSTLKQLARQIKAAFTCWRASEHKIRPNKDLRCTLSSRALLFIKTSLEKLAQENGDLQADKLNSLFNATEEPVSADDLPGSANYLQMLMAVIEDYVHADHPLQAESRHIAASIKHIASQPNNPTLVMARAQLINWFNSITDYAKNDSVYLGHVPLNAQKYEPRNDPQSNEPIPVTHGGGLFYMCDFLYGRRTGYRMNNHTRGTGIYAAIQSEGYFKSASFAKSTAFRFFDIPAVMQATIQPKHCDRSASYEFQEAVVRHTNRKELTITDIKPVV